MVGLTQRVELEDAPRLAAWILPRPNWLFGLLAVPLIRIDPVARSSMADDLPRGRPTEVQDINGEIVALGQAHGVATPINRHLIALIPACEAGHERPGLTAERLWPTHHPSIAI